MMKKQVFFCVMYVAQQHIIASTQRQSPDYKSFVQVRQPVTAQHALLRLFEILSLHLCHNLHMTLPFMGEAVVFSTPHSKG